VGADPFATEGPGRAGGSTLSVVTAPGGSTEGSASAASAGNVPGAGTASILGPGTRNAIIGLI
jgi:hypothetical protein